MATIASLKVDLIGSSAQFRTEMVRGQRQANQSLGTIQADAKRTAESITAMTRAAAGFVGFQFAKEGVRQLLDAQVQMQAIHYTFLASTGSAQAAGDAFDFVRAESEKLGLSLQPAAEGFAKLSASASALNVPMQQQKELFDAFAKASTTLHLSTENSNRALLALEQMFAKGKIQAQELRLQLGQAIPGAAARFQQAVLQMTKGTELQGKSFDQLLQSGELYTDKFLPALVTALQQSGRGWKDASEGLNSQLNRLRTSWFELKADVSGGLFNDAAIQSVKFMAAHLDDLAAAAGIAGGVVAARLAGKGLAAGAGGLASLSALTAARVADAQAATVQAERELAVASAQASSAAAARANTAAKIESLKQTLATDLGEKERTATLARLGAATARLVGENIAYRDSLVGVTAAQVAARTSEAELAAVRSAGAISTAARGLGQGALALVGGVWGAAALAIGGVAYAIYNLHKRSEEYREETAKQVKSLQDLREQALEAAKSYGTLNAAMGLSQSVSLLGTSSDELAKKKQELADLVEQANGLREAMSHRGGGGMLAGMDLDNLNDRITKLRAELEPTQSAVTALSDATRVRLTPSVDGLKNALDALKSGGGVRGFFAALPTPEEVAAYASGIDNARKAVQDIQAKMQADTKNLTDQVATSGMSEVQKQQYALQQGIAKIRAQNLTPAASASQINDLTASAAPAIQAAAQKDAQDAAKKAAQEATTALNRQSEAYATLTNSQNAQLQSLHDQIDGGEKLSAAQRELNQMLAGGDKAFRALSDAQQADAIARQRSIVALTQQTAAMADAKKQAEALAIVQDNLARISQQYSQQREDSLAGIGHGQKYAEEAAGMRDIQRQYDALMARAGHDLTKGTISQGTYDQEVAQYKAALDQQLADQQEFYHQRDVMQGDWKNGAIAAMEDWRDAAANVSGQVADMVTNAANNMTDAFVQFALTGKLSFKDFADSIIKDLARIAYQKAIAGIFESVLGAMGSGGASTASGGSYYSNMGGNGAGDGGYGMMMNYGGGRASGGSTTGGTLYEVAEGGRPELYQSGGRTYLLSGQNGNVVPAGRGGAAVASGSAEMPEVIINITNNGQAVQAKQTGQRMDGKKMMVDLILDTVSGDTAKGGRTAQAMQQRFGLSRRGVPVGG